MSVIPILPAAWLERQQHRRQSAYPELWDLLDTVKDPEVPVLSLWDLGVLSDVIRNDVGQVQITITPTYSGCPALETMRADITQVLEQAGHTDFEIRTQLSPAWTTDWLSPDGREQLRAYGIAPPRQENCAHASGLTPESGIECPLCQSVNTTRISEFGSTACKALFQCRDCLEPFDYFKQI